VQLHAADQVSVTPLLEKEFKLYLAMPDGENMELPYTEYQALIFIENSLIREMVIHNTTYNDIIIELPNELQHVQLKEITDFLQITKALYGYLQEPTDQVVLQTLQNYLSQFGSLTAEQTIHHLMKVKLLAEFFQYQQFATKLKELLSLLNSVFASDLILLNMKFIGGETPLEVLKWLSSKVFTFFDNKTLVDKINRAKIIALILNYPLMLDAFIRFDAVITLLNRLEQVSQRGRLSPTIIAQREELTAQLMQSIQELTGFVEPTENQLKQAYDYLLQFFSTNKSSFYFRKIKELSTQINKSL
jgi:hypothetical protein